MKRHTTYKESVLLLLMMAAVVLAACSDDSSSESDETDTLQLVAYTHDRSDVNVSLTRADVSLTRAVTLPSGYTEYTGSNSIGVYTATADEAPASVRTFTYNEAQNAWRSLVSVKRDVDYYIYGYMPTTSEINCSISKLGENYANGAILTFSNLPPVLAHDFSIVSGILQLPNANPLTAGNFAYTGKQNGQNYVCLMLDHLYSCVRMKFKVGTEYNKLRTIKLKKVELKSGNQLTYPLEVTLKQAPATPAYSLSWGESGSFSTDFVTVYTSEEGVELLTTDDDAPTADGYFAPQSEISSNIVLRCTYDVYDKKGNMTRQGCTAENKLPSTLLTAGFNQRNLLTITVEPTYLYVMSDPDLDNPTVTISGGGGG